VNEKCAEAWINRTDHAVYGLTLRPFSLRVSFILDALRSPFLSGLPLDPHTLWIAAQVCANSGWCPRLRPLGFLRGARHRFHHEHHAFLAYIADYQTPPEFWSKVEPGKEPADRAVPWSLQMVRLLSQRLGLSLSEAWELPTGQAWWLHAAIAEGERSYWEPSPVVTGS